MINHKINLCKCGTQPDLYSFYIKGTANRIHWCIKCPNCQKRTQHRRKMEKAIEEWNKEWSNNTK